MNDNEDNEPIPFPKPKPTGLTPEQIQQMRSSAGPASAKLAKYSMQEIQEELRRRNAGKKPLKKRKKHNK